ncbi:MAG: serine/threonine-protein kinase [Acidobacteria bacterium]|nr:serine/threonine-protein kinase [Acidobacteriota bacterium]
MALKPGTRLGQYEIRGLIGAGGMGEVYQGLDTKLERDVAIKVLPEAFARDPERIARFKREAKVLASLNHNNIAAIYDLEESAGRHFLVMEMVEGATLAEMIHQSRDRKGAEACGLALDEALRITTQICEALEHAHEKTVIHRDLKPANVKVTPEGTVKVLDFGLAKAYAASSASGEMAGRMPTPLIDSNSPTLSALPSAMANALANVSPSLPGVILGTAAYMSPEQAKGKTVDRRTDIWALGCVLYELLTGHGAFHGFNQSRAREQAVNQSPDRKGGVVPATTPPLAGARGSDNANAAEPDTVQDIIARVLQAEPEWTLLPASLPHGIGVLLRRALEKDPKKRYRDAADIKIQIEETLAVPVPLPAAAIPAPPLWRRALPWVVAAVAGIVAAVALFILYFGSAPTEALPIQFSIGPPDKGLFSPLSGFLTVSPDGTKVAFVAAGSSGKAQLWVRPLDSQTSQPLPGTDNVNTWSPFWSPDSRFLAFSADGKLKKIAVAGGPAQTLTDATGNSMGAWSREGVILFAPATRGPIYRVSAAGGAATQLTTLDASRQENGHYNPYFLPDGKHFLYFNRSSNAEKNAIFLGSLDSKETKLLLNASSNAVYVPPGYLLFNREGTLMAQGFDANRLELTGEAVPIAEGVQFSATNWRAAFAASDNGVLIYRAGLGIAGQFTWLDRSGKELSRLGEVYDFNQHFSLSRDEKHIAVDLASPTANDLWLFDLARGSSSRFTFALPSPTNGSGRPVVWTPDGSLAIFDGAAGGTVGLFQKLTNGAGQPESLLKVPASSVMDLSRDGRFLLYQQNDTKTRYDLWVLPLFGDPRQAGTGGKQPKPFLQTPFDEGHAQFSPDGRWVAYTSNESGRPEVYVQPFPGPGGKWQVSTGGGMVPLWRSDGKELFYLYRGRLMSAEVRTGAQFEAGAPQELFEPQVGLTHGMEAGNHYAVSADGKRFLIIRAKESTQAFPITVVLNWPALLKK